MFFFWIFRSRDKTAAERAFDRRIMRWAVPLGFILIAAWLYFS